MRISTSSSVTILRVSVVLAVGTFAVFMLFRSSEPAARAAESSKDAGLPAPGSASPSLVAAHEPLRVAVPALPPASSTQPEEATPPAPQRYSYTFLPEELQPLSTMIPERLDAFEKATPVEQLQLGRELLVHSIAVLMCASGTGPIERGQPGDGDLSYAGRDGRWSFQINTSTFHFHESQYPEYPEYMKLLRSSYDEQMVPLATPVELTPDLAQRIRVRVHEALAWL